MPRITLRFVRALQIAFIALMLIALAIASYLGANIRQNSEELERLTLASTVQLGFQEVSSLALRQMVVLSNSVLRGEGVVSPDASQAAATLRDAVSRLRKSIAAEGASGGSAVAGVKPESLVEIERRVEELIRSSRLIEEALRAGNLNDARKELEVLENAGLTHYFSSLGAATAMDPNRQTPVPQGVLLALSPHLIPLLPISMFTLAILTLFITFFLSRLITRSLSALHEGVKAYRNGNLSHRIPQLSEMEFQRLGEAFNSMAEQLSGQSKALRDANARLEMTVDERTRSLQDSNRKLAEADANRRKLLADMSHEFRTPLTVIRGEAEIALRGSNKTETDYRESFQRIVDQADNTTRLVDDLLFMARADAGEPRLKLDVVAVAGMVDAVCQEFAAKAEHMKIPIVQGRMDAKAVVRGDPGRLRQVIAILMDNALRYSNPGGRIEVRVAKMNENVEIVVRDEGIGLSEDQSELVFQRFYRAPNAENQAPGTGLGLPVAKAIVEAHNGTISLKGQLDEGATATVVLPIGGTFGVDQ